MIHDGVWWIVALIQTLFPLCEQCFFYPSPVETQCDTCVEIPVLFLECQIRLLLWLWNGMMINQWKENGWIIFGKMVRMGTGNWDLAWHQHQARASRLQLVSLFYLRVFNRNSPAGQWRTTARKDPPETPTGSERFAHFILNTHCVLV